MPNLNPSSTLSATVEEQQRHQEATNTTAATDDLTGETGDITPDVSAHHPSSGDLPSAMMKNVTFAGGGGRGDDDGPEGSNTKDSDTASGGFKKRASSIVLSDLTTTTNPGADDGGGGLSASSALVAARAAAKLKRSIYYSNKSNLESDTRKKLAEERSNSKDAASTDGGGSKNQRVVPRFIFFPWNPWYKCWWGFTVIWSILTVVFESYRIAFEPGGMGWSDPSTCVEYAFTAIFVIDILVNFNLAYYDADQVVYDRKKIARQYCRKMFWIDLIGVFPFYYVALAIGGLQDVDNSTTQYLALLKLFRFVRLYRVKQLVDILQYNSHVSLMWLTLIRNFGVALVWAHLSACIMYFIARQYNFDDDTTWIGSQVAGLTPGERYCTALYWSVVTFTTGKKAVTAKNYADVRESGDWIDKSESSPFIDNCLELPHIVLKHYIYFARLLCLSTSFPSELQSGTETSHQ